MPTSLRAYKALVLAAMQRAQERHRPEVFENTGPEHARIVLEVMLDQGKRSVDVIAGGMSSDVWPASKIADFLRRNKDGQIRVLLDREPIGEVPATSVLCGVLPHGRVQVKWLQEPLRQHLCIVDREHARLEYDKRTREASITFGDAVDFGMRATEIFNSIWISIPLLESDAIQMDEVKDQSAELIATPASY